MTAIVTAIGRHRHRPLVNRRRNRRPRLPGPCHRQAIDRSRNACPKTGRQRTARLRRPTGRSLALSTRRRLKRSAVGRCRILAHDRPNPSSPHNGRCKSIVRHKVKAMVKAMVARSRRPTPSPRSRTTTGTDLPRPFPESRGPTAAFFVMH
jgi:hypothetical protein